MQQERRTLSALHFLKNILPRIFFNLVPKESFCPQVYIFNKVQKEDEVVTQIDLCGGNIFLISLTDKTENSL